MRTTINIPDADYRRVVELARQLQRKPNELIVLLAREALTRRLQGQERVARFRQAMRDIYGGLDEQTVRSLDGRDVEQPPRT